jgi:inorganic pyrophosphatase
MIVEVPKGSANKYEYDPQLCVFRLDRALYSPMHFPGDYGFVPGTIAEDGEPLDILCLTSHSSFPGCSMEVRPVGMLDMIDAGHVDHKILAVPAGDPRFSAISEVEDVFPHIRREVEHFFTIYKELEEAPTSIESWHGLEEAFDTLRRCRESFKAGSRTSV